MQITEPMTMLTDYALGALTAFLAVRLWQSGRSSRQVSVKLWAAAFLATALAALVGGTYHGFALYLGGLGQAALWKVTVYSIGLTAFLMLAGATMACVARWQRKTLLALAAGQFAVYGAWMITHDEFRYVIYDYAPAMVAILVIEGWALASRRDPAAPWVIGGILVSFAAAGIQQSGFSLHAHFNHNDLYHVMEMVAVYLLYRGGRLLKDRLASAEPPG